MIFLVLLAFGLLLVLPKFWAPLQWSPDGLFYQAQVRELRGESKAEALAKFTDPLGQAERQTEVYRQDLTDPTWVEYSTRFYRRRWVVSLLAAALTPIAGLRSLEIVSLLGLALIGPLLYLLLRARFSRLVGGLAGAFCAVLPPVLLLAPEPRTDSVALCLLIVALILAVQVARKGPRWLPAWVLAILVLSFTRDETVVALTGVAWLAFRERSRVLAWATGLGLLASIPAPLIFSAPLKDNFTYLMNNFHPGEASWGTIASHYPGLLWAEIRGDINFSMESPTPPWTFLLGLVLVVGLAMLFLAGRRRGTLPTLARGSVVGAVLTVLLAANYTQLRIELVFIPAVAVGVALLFEALLARFAVAASPAPAYQ